MSLILISSCYSSKFKTSSIDNSDPISNELKNKIQVIKLKKSIGIIFPAEYKMNFNQNLFVNRFTPTEKEVRDAENEIEKKYLKSEKKIIYDQVYVKTNEIYGNQKINKQKEYSKLIKSAVKEAKKSPKFYRQYAGYIENGEKKLIINFIDFSKDPYNLKSKLKTKFIIGFGEWFETNTRIKIYNYKSKKLTVL